MQDIIGNWISFALSAIALGTVVYGWLTSGEKQVAKDLADFMEKHGERHSEIDDDLAEHDRRIQSVEAELKHLPDKDSVVELKISLTELKGNVNTLSESMGSIARTVHRIDDWLRQEK